MVAQELEKLARLHESGALTDDAANRYVTFQIGMSIVGLIVFLVVFVVFFLPRFNSFPQP